jgi:tetratricopeptide (TPR) repeat protein
MVDEDKSNSWDYLDFELELSKASGSEYSVSVKSPAGEAEEVISFPFGELELSNSLKDLKIALLYARGSHRKVFSKEECSVQDFGKRLFDFLISKEVRSLYDISRREATVQEKGLRLKLRIQPPELAALPWEFLFDSRQADYICLSRDTPLVRYLDLPQPILPLEVARPLRILCMVASPSDLPPLNTEVEKQRVQEALKHLIEKGTVEIAWLKGQTWRDLQTAMLKGPWNIFHFIGHGGFDNNKDEGIIALSDENGKASYMNATKLGRLLADHKSLRLVVLNSCEGAYGSDNDIFSSTAAILVRRGIPAVIAMQYEITDRTAIEFARTFYDSLSEGLPIDASVAEGRKAVDQSISLTLEWGVPVLYMRAPDGILFKLDLEQIPIGITKEQSQRNVRPPTAVTPISKAGDNEPNAAESTLSEIPVPKERPSVHSSSAFKKEEATARYDKGIALGKQGKHDEAIKDYDEAIKLDPNNADVWNNKGNFLNDLKNCAEAIKAVTLDPHYADYSAIFSKSFWKSKGDGLYFMKNYAEAIKAYDEAIKLDPNNADVWNNKGNALKKLGLTIEANEAYAKAKELGHKD